ncbi:hypothetical protein [Tepidicaulis sp.]|uniref:hypothetical protein n=1 Tax=Tepidicaulis sp. TaxID=1920809 RepID=UPI003B5A8B2D
MSKFTHAVLAASIAFTAGVSPAAAGNMIVQDGVQSADLTPAQSVYTVELKEMSGGSNLNAANVQVLTDKVTFRASGMLVCEKITGIRPNAPLGADIGFGAFNPTFGDAGVVHKAEFDIGVKYYNNSQNEWVNDPAAVQNWEVPLNSLKNAGKPDYEFDALKIFNAEMQKFIDNGGTKLDFLKQDRVIEVERFLSIYTGCRKLNGQLEVTKLGYGTDVEPITMKIKYKGNPNLLEPAIVAVTPGGNNQVNAGYQPLKITYAAITPYAPSYVGKCPANLKFRVQIKGQGKGHVKFRVHGKSDESWLTENLTQIYESGPRIFNAPEGGTDTNFFYEVPFSGQDVLNKTINHQFRLAITWKDEKADTYETHYQTFATKDWKRRCTPQVSVGIGGQPGGVSFDNGQGGQGGNNAGGLTIQAQPVAPSLKKVAPSAAQRGEEKPARAAPARMETAPAERAPTRAAPARQTEPAPMLQIAPRAAEPAPARSTR